MPEFLVLLLMQVTVFSSVTALILIAVKQIFACRIPPLIGTMMWVVLLARLVCPIFPESSISVYNYIPVGRDIMFSLTYDVGEQFEEREAISADRDNPYVLRAEEAVVVSAEGAGTMEEEVPAEEGHPVPENTSVLDWCLTEEAADCLILAVYLLGIAGTLTGHLTVYFRAKRRALLFSFSCEDEGLYAVYRATAASLGIPENRLPELRMGTSSMVVGIGGGRSCILCREEIDKREAGMMFAHELIHYKHHDNALLLFATVIACFYWYNPLIWLVRAMLREDIEVLCDSRTLTECGIVSTDYAMMLCRNSAFGELVSAAGCQMSASGRHLKNRLRTISRRSRSRRSRNWLSRAGSLLLCTVIMMLCLTNPIVSQSSEYSVYIENYASLTGEDKRAMHFQNGVTVSIYLEQIGNLLAEKTDTDIWSRIGGNLETFKRLCASNDELSPEINREVQKMKTDELLTSKSCAILSECVITLLSSEREVSAEEFPLLPDVISVEDMDRLLVNLTESEENAVLSCYNRGVRGADVQFERIYTSAMMELILSRINDEWVKLKLSGFYQKIESERPASYALSTALLDMLNKAGADEDVYVLDPSTTEAEENVLRELLRTASAGEDEEVYYRKSAEDGCDWKTAAFLFYRAGYTHEEMLRNYAEIGDNYTDIAMNAVAYPVVRDANAVMLTGTATESAGDAMRHIYSLGILDAEDGVLDTGHRLTRGESLEAAYRLVYSAVELDVDVN
ncbi:MAG: hypothetical protein J6I42_05395 [Clostridia bacterium]|nr:hypothetical protein [Clostridia bacterium]